MKRFIYTRLDDGGLSVVTPLPKEYIEELLGPMSEEAYEAHVLEQSIPDGVTSWRFIEDTDIPASREFRNAWADITLDPTVDIDAAKARDLKLAELRDERNKVLASTDVDFMKALESGDQTSLNSIKEKRQALRDATDPLKNLDISGAADEALLSEIKSLAILNIAE